MAGIKYRAKWFWSLIISVLVVVALSFGVEAVLSQTLPQELAPEQGVDGPVGNIGVPVEINGAVRELQVGDVVAAGSVVANVNHIELLDRAFNALGPEAETATILSAVSHVLSLPSQVCDFNDAQIGSSLATNLITEETKTEVIRFSVAKDCKLKFEGKSSDFEAGEPAIKPSSSDTGGIGGTSWFLPSNTLAVVPPDAERNAPRYKLENDDACRSVDFIRERKDFSLSKEVGSGTSQSGSTNTAPRAGNESGSLLSVALVGLVRIEDQHITVKIEGSTVDRDIGISDDCGVFLSTVEATYINDDGSRSFATSHPPKNVCSSWRIQDGPFNPGGVTDTNIWEIERCKKINDSNTTKAQTGGVFHINFEDNLFLDSLREAGYKDKDLMDMDIYDERYELTTTIQIVTVGGREKVNYSCTIDKLPYVEIDTSLLTDRERIKVINGKTYIQIGGDNTIVSHGWRPPTGKEGFNALKDGELYVQVPEDDSTINSYLECRVAFFKTQGIASLASRAPIETSPGIATPDTRRAEYTGNYVSRFFPGITFTKSKNILVDDLSRPALYSLERRIEVAQQPRQVTLYNYEVPVYNYVTETRSRDVEREVFNYRTVPVYNYETRSRTRDIPVYNYATRPAYNYRTRPAYNYETRRTTCKRRSWIFVCVEWNYERVRVAPYTRQVRVAPYTRQVRVAPLTRTVEEEYQHRIAPYTKQERIDPRTETVEEEYTVQVRVAPYKEVRSFSGPQSNSAYTRVAPFSRTETPPPIVEWRRMTVSNRLPTDRNVREVAYYKRRQKVSAQVNFDGTQVISCVGLCATNRTYILTAPVVAHLNGNDDVGWERGTLRAIKDVRNYDVNQVIGDTTKVMVYETFDLVTGLSSRTTRPFQFGANSLTVGDVLSRVQVANNVRSVTRALRETLVRNRFAN